MADLPGPNDILPCGTPAARQRHLAHGEELCWECRQQTADVVVVCGGREVDRQLRPRGERCGKRLRLPARVGGLARMAAVDRLVRIEGARQIPATYEDRPPTVDEVVEVARAAGWALPDGQGRVDTGELVGICPRCRRPPPEVVDLVRDRKANGRTST